MSKRRKLALGVTLALTAAGAANAGVLFNPNGTGRTGALDLGAFDWAQTAFVAVGGTQAVINFQNNNCANGGCDFTVYTQAVLRGTNDQAGAINTPAGLNQNYEITMVLGYNERVTAVPPEMGGQAIATFQAVPTAVSFLEVFRDTNLNANQLTGYGFNDGTLILSGSGVTESNGLFSVNLAGAGATPATANIDQFGTDNYTGQSTVTGQGSTGDFSINNLAWDPRYFVNGLAEFGVTMSNISQQLPFVTVDPMDCFTSTTSGGAIGSAVPTGGCANVHVNGTFAANAGGNGAGSYVPNVGLVNGLFGGGGPDFTAQTDFNSPLIAPPVTPPQPTPEPASLAMLGLGLGLLGAFKRRRA